MQLRFTPLLCLSLVLAGAGTPGHAQQASIPRAAWPSWLLERTKEYETKSPALVPVEIWQLTRNGEPAYYVVAPCCDQFNHIYSSTGVVLCSPSGGITGGGDRKCPNPPDAGTKVLFVWAHPKSAQKQHLAPRWGRS